MNEGWVQIRKGLTGHIKSSVPLSVRVEIQYGVCSIVSDLRLRKFTLVRVWSMYWHGRDLGLDQFGFPVLQAGRPGWRGELKVFRRWNCRDWWLVIYWRLWEEKVVNKHCSRLLVWVMVLPFTVLGHMTEGTWLMTKLARNKQLFCTCWFWVSMLTVGYLAKLGSLGLKLRRELGKSLRHRNLCV